MTVNRWDLLQEIGKRLKQVRTKHELSIEGMISNLGSTRNRLHKYENGFCMLSLDTLYMLHKRFSISMDWLLFNFGPMSLGEKITLQESALVKESVSGELQKLIELMQKDSVFMHEIMGHYHKYTSGKE